MRDSRRKSLNLTLAGNAALEGVPQAHRPDGTHLTPTGYRALISAIRPALE